MMNESLRPVAFLDHSILGRMPPSWPMHLLGIAGHPRRYSELSGVQYVAAMAPLQKFVTVAAIVTLAGQVIFLVIVLEHVQGPLGRS